MKKLLIIALCLLAVFAVVSCKNEPKPEPEPAVETFTVTFNTGEGGSAVPVAKVEKDGVALKPANPTRKGYAFYTWFKESTFENIYDFTTPVTEDITLYAKWVQGAPEEVETVKLTATADADGFQLQWIFDAQNAIKEGDVLSFKYKSTKPFVTYTIRKMTGSKATSGKLAESAAYTEDTADDDGWHTFSYTVAGSVAATDIGIGLRLEPAEDSAIGDVLYIKEVTYTTASATKELSVDKANIYYGTEPTIEKSFIRLVATLGGIPEGEVHNYSQDKFRLTWEDVEVKPGDVFTMVYKVKRTDEATKDRAFQFSLRDGSVKWIYECDPGTEYPAYWSTISEPDLDGWITVTYVFPPADVTPVVIKEDKQLPSGIGYPSSFIVDFRDEYFASPAEGHIADIVYLRSASITTVDPEDPEKTITTPLVLDEEATADLYSCPTIERFFFPAEAE